MLKISTTDRATEIGGPMRPAYTYESWHVISNNVAIWQV